MCALIFAITLPSCRHRIPPEYEYSAGWITEEHSPVRSESLSGTVEDASGAPRGFVLVERTSPDFKTRLDATLTDSRGQFRLRSARSGNFYLRFRLRGFNDYLLLVEVSPQGAPKLHVRLNISNYTLRTRLHESHPHSSVRWA
jgi:Carboxypeptidase regulatory-like domain